ncbi:MAG TPA: DUF4255 domain-containing protein, partial [Saprospiraceae bacterium]|nr:DUF4255 domain-containing protein [Saprospiraceae bacterium]
SSLNVVVENIGSTTEKNKVIITLIKIAEENTLRNGKYSRIDQSFKTAYKNRPVFTNLYVLFSCNHGDYNAALTKLSQVVEFFQGQSVFTHLDGLNGVVGVVGDVNEKFKLIVELQEMSFEQINYIWSFLGGKQLPSVLYKVRMIPIEALKINGQGTPIMEINIDDNAGI